MPAPAACESHFGTTGVNYTVGIETSGSIGSVALLRGEELVAERTLGETGRRHARTLVAELQSLLGDAGTRPRDVETVAVSIGPGSFTGLRVGVVCAKTWAFATGSRLAAVETFAAVVRSLPGSSSTVWVIDDALRGDVYVQRYESAANDRWTARDSVRLLPFDDWLTEASRDDVVCGPGADRWREELLSHGLQVAENAHRPTAENVARVGRELALHGRFADPFALVPLYIRRSAAEEKLDSMNASGAKS